MFYYQQNARVLMEDVYSKSENMLNLANREQLSLKGVIDVHSFNEDTIIAETQLGLLTVGGRDLRITVLSLDNQRLEIKGYIDSLQYSDQGPARKGSGFFDKIFK